MAGNHCNYYSFGVLLMADNIRRGGEQLVSEKNDPLMKQTGGALRALREGRGFSRERLCERVGISVRHLSAIELGDKNPSISILFQLIRSMGASADRVVYPELFTEDSDLQQCVLFGTPPGSLYPL